VTILFYCEVKGTAGFALRHTLPMHDIDVPGTFEVSYCFFFHGDNIGGRNHNVLPPVIAKKLIFHDLLHGRSLRLLDASAHIHD